MPNFTVPTAASILATRRPQSLGGLGGVDLAKITRIMLDDPRKLISSVEITSNLWEPIVLQNPLLSTTTQPNPAVEALMTTAKPQIQVRFREGAMDSYLWAPYGTPTPGKGAQVKQVATVAAGVGGLIGALAIGYLAYKFATGGQR